VSDATVSDLIAASFITAIPPTLVAAGSWLSSRKAKHAATEAKAEAAGANRAVNNRPPGEPSLYELAVRAVTVAEVNVERVAELAEKVDRVDRKVDHHLAAHRVEDERRSGRDRRRRWWQR